jgi:malate synthase
MSRMAIAAFQPEPRYVQYMPLRRPEWNEILTQPAVEFVARLARVFEPRRRELLADRRRRQAEIDAGVMPDFLPHTQSVRKAVWTVATPPADLVDRRVEITGPVNRKMIINGLNSGANVFMADFEDATSPTWANVLDGQLNLRDAVRRDILFVSADGKLYELSDRCATLMVRPRGWHLDESHFIVDGKPVSASIFDFGLFFFHNAHELIRRGTGPYFYLPKLENHAEASLWNDIFLFSQEALGIPRGTIRATVLIETITAAFEMDEILYELREHSAGLNCGRWDYIFSFIKKFRNHPEFVLPDRSQVTMDRHFLNSYVELLIHTCHRRGIHAMGGMAAHIPIRSDPAANEEALERVRRDKLREVAAGHDGTWVAHPALVPVAKEIFDQHMRGPNQIWRMSHDVQITAQDLLTVPPGTITEQGLRRNIDVAIRYVDSWLRGTGCVPIYNLMEDTATAEICRTQVWQWVKFGAKLDDGRPVTEELVRELIASQVKRIRLFTGVEGFHKGLYRRASTILQNWMTGPEPPEFLTAAAYDQLD